MAHSTLVPLNLPPYPFKLKQQANTVYIYDEIRHKYLILTPEEWVRQHFVQWLISEKKYPKTLIQIEKGIKINTLQKRTDILIFNNLGDKIMLVECKAPHVKITQNTLTQIAQYNIVHQVEWLVVTNGLQHYYCRINFLNNSYTFEKNLPEYFSR